MGWINQFRPKVDHRMEVDIALGRGDYIADKIPANYHAHSAITVTDAVAKSGIKYSSQAGLRVSSYVVCDNLNKGTYKTFDISQSDSLANEAAFNQLGVPTSGGDLFNTVISPQAITSSLTGSYLNLGAVRFCKVRHVFEETNAFTAAPKLRSWMKHDATISNQLQVNDPPPEGEVSEGVTE